MTAQEQEAGPADPVFDRFARVVAGSLDVPVALVTLVDAVEQVMPGAVGLPEPWQTRRRTPLTMSLCQYVLAGHEPLVVEDVRAVAELADSLAIPELGVVAYAGVPIHDGERIVGALCAIDTGPRPWTDQDVMFLRDIASACSSVLAVRGARRTTDTARDAARAARAAQEAAERTTEAARHAEARMRLLLELSDALVGTTTAEDVTATVTRLAREHLGAVEAHVVPAGAPEADGDGEVLRTPLRLPGRTIGRLDLTFGGARDPAAEESVVTALAHYTAAALDRAALLQERRDAAAALQAALLPSLPTSGAFHVEARYVPASDTDQVGGDWYDAVYLPHGTLKLTIGDVVGHDIAAAAQMGQLRSYLRGLSYDRVEPPGATLTRLDGLMRGLGLGAVASAMLAFVRPGEAGHATVTWSSAGHPPALLLDPVAGVRVLEGRPGLLLGIPLELPRADHTLDMAPGATLLMFTDGLIERRGRTIPDGLDALTRAVGGFEGAELPELLDAVLGALIGEGFIDDCAVLAVRVPAAA